MKALKEQVMVMKHLESITGKELYEIIKNEEKDVESIVEEFIENLNIGLTDYINIFEPEAICIGGSFSYFEDLILDRLIKEMHEKMLTFNNTVPDIKIAKMRK